jgi:hypothetical protein
LELLHREVGGVEDNNGTLSIRAVRCQRIEHEDVVGPIEGWLNHNDMLTPNSVLK